MVDDLKKKSNYSFIIIVIIFLLLFFITVVLVYSEKSTAENVNTAGKQRMLSQRIALLCNNYYDNPSNEKLTAQIKRELGYMISNHSVIKNIGNKKIDEILYDSRYHYDSTLNLYKENVLKFLSTKSLKYLKVINYTNESLLRIADTLVEVMEIEFKKFINFFLTVMFFLSIIFILVLYFIYKKVTLRSILDMQDALYVVQNDKLFINSILDNSAHAIITTTPDGIITLFNKEAEILLGYKSEDLINKQTPALFHKKEEVVKRAEEFSKKFNTTIEPGFDVFIEKTKRGLKNSDEWTYIDKEGKEIMVRLSVTSLKNEKDSTIGYLGIAEDITSEKIKEFEIKNYLKLIDENIITSTTDLKGNITFSSKAFNEISGYKKDELIGKNHNIVRHEDMPDEIYKELWETISNNQVWHGEIKNKKKDGGFYWVSATIYPIYDFYKNKIGYTAIRQDITDKKMIEIISITDGLTNLYNRRHFNNISQRELDRARREKNIFAFVLLDIDNFKKYNDTYGHQDGDNVLINVASSLKNSFKRSGDIVFRLGGEEFGIILYAKKQEEVSIIVEEARVSIEALNIEHKQNLPSKVVTASFGVGIAYVGDFSKHYSIDSIYKDVDELLYKAKESGRNKIVVGEV